MELIALFARVNKTRFIDNAHSLIKTYLEQTATIKNSRLHIRRFYEYFELFSGSDQNQPIDLNSLKLKINAIVQKINSELNEEERIVFFLSFLELIKLDKRVETEELQFAEILSVELHISRKDYKNSLIFILSEQTDNSLEENQDFLLISAQKNNNSDELEGSWIEQNRPRNQERKMYLIRESLEGEVLILRLHGSHFIVGRYFGNEALLLNNRKYLPGNFFLIGQFDQLKIGSEVKLSYQEIIAGFRSGYPHSLLKFTGDNVSTKASGNIIRIAPFNFCEEPGHLVLVLCNNSIESKNLSLLLTGQIPLSSGKICLNGHNIYSDRYRVHKMIGLVPRENIFDENVSIYENLRFSARLSFPGYSEQKVGQIVNQTIQSFGLTEFSHVPIRKINHGMPSEYLKILINTSIEIIRDPFILVLDIPLEKLNSTNAEEFCNILKTESNKGKLIFVTSTNAGNCILKKIDRMWIFDSGGYIIYRGLAGNVLNYFQNAGNNLAAESDVCPICGNLNADQLYQIIHAKVIDNQGKITHSRRISPEEWYNIYKRKVEAGESPSESRKVIPSYASSIPNVNLQFSAYLKKHFLSLISNPRKYLMVLTGGLIIAFLTAGLLRYDWSDNYQFSQHEFLPLLFFLNTIICFVTGAVIGLNFTLDDKIHLAYDHFKNYSFFSYLNVKYLLLTIQSLIFSLLFTYITDSISGISSLFLVNWLIYFSTFFIGGSIGLFLGYIGYQLRNSIFITAILLVLNVLFSGYILPYNSLPKQLASDKYVPAFAEIFPGRWAYEALIVRQAKDNKYQKMLFQVEQQISDLTFKTNVLIPKLQEQLYNSKQSSSKPLNFRIFYKDLKEINNRYPEIYPFEFLEELNEVTIKEYVITELEEYMRFIQFQLYEKLEVSLDRKNKLRNSLKDSLGQENYTKLLKSNFNVPLQMYVSAKKPGRNFIETDGEIIQTDEPIYRLPDNNFGRSHFFAPQKLMNGFYYDTTYFNLFALWLEIFLVYLSTLILRKKTVI